MHPLRFRTILLAALAVILIAGMAAAQVRPAYVKNVDEPGRAPYQQMVHFSPQRFVDCSAPCVVPFNAVPAGKRLVVEHVTMLVAVLEGQPLLLAFGQNAILNENNIAIIGGGFTYTGITTDSGRWFAIDHAVKVYYEAGAIPKLKLVYSGTLHRNVENNASLHGYLIDANN